MHYKEVICLLYIMPAALLVRSRVFEQADGRKMTRARLRNDLWRWKLIMPPHTNIMVKTGFGG